MLSYQAFPLWMASLPISRWELSLPYATKGHVCRGWATNLDATDLLTPHTHLSSSGKGGTLPDGTIGLLGHFIHGASQGTAPNLCQ